MSAYGGPEINQNGLIFSVDAKNIQSFNAAAANAFSTTDHGYSDWVCLESGTATYSLASGGISIFETTTSGVTTTIVPASDTPKRGTITITAGYIYFGNGPINLVPQDYQHKLAPTTMAGTQFWYIPVRSNPSTFYVYSPNQQASINFYDGSLTGLAGTPTNTLILTTKTIGTFTTNNLQNMWLSSNTPIIATVTQTGPDKTILSPMANYVYNATSPYYNTTNNTTPTTLGTGSSPVTYDSTYKVMTMNIGDGSGGDCAQGLGYEYLSKYYSWGDLLSDYQIAAPYSNTNITTYFWTGSGWNVWDTHSLNGTQTSPVYIQRDGSTGPGANAAIIAGFSSYMAGNANLWKWESNQPFYLRINDTADDELAVLGWNTPIQSSNSGAYLIDTVGNNHLMIYGNPTYSNSSFDFANNQITQYMMNKPFPFPTDDHTVEFWMYINSSKIQTPLTYSSISGDNSALCYFPNITTFQPFTQTAGGGSANSFTVPSVLNKWTHVVRTRIKSSGLQSYYIDGSLVGSETIFVNSAMSSNGVLIVGQESDSQIGGAFDPAQCLDGKISRISVYNRALSADEVSQNFKFFRSRFGV